MGLLRPGPEDRKCSEASGKQREWGARAHTSIHPSACCSSFMGRPPQRDPESFQFDPHREVPAPGFPQIPTLGKPHSNGMSVLLAAQPTVGSHGLSRLT